MDKQARLTKSVEFEAYCVSVSRRCFAAEHGGCNCTGACKTPVSGEVRIRELEKELAKEKNRG